MSALDAIFNGKPKATRKGVCAFCDLPSRAQVLVRIAELDDHGNTIAGRSRSLSTVLCVEHGVTAYDSAREAIRR